MRKVYAIYFSPTGNTGRLVKAAAKAAATDLGIGSEVMDFTLPEQRKQDISFTDEDLVFLGVPTYAGRVPNKIMPFIRDNIRGCGAAAVAMVTYGNRSYDESLKELAVLMKENDFDIVGAGAFVCEHAFAEKLATGRPDRNDMELAEQFGRTAGNKAAAGGFVRGENWECEPVGPYYVPKKEDGQPAVFLKAKPKTDEDKCRHCGHCEAVCPMEGTGICIKCQACIKVCKYGARYFDHEDFLSHKKMLEENFADRENQPEIFI